MSKKLFVGRLPFDYTDEKLEALFAGVGTVASARMIPDPKQGRTRGFGFVDMKTDEEAVAAIAKLNGHTIGDRQIWVTIARPKNSDVPGARRPELPIRGKQEWKPREGAPKPRTFGNPRFRSQKPGGSGRFGRGARPGRGSRP